MPNDRVRHALVLTAGLGTRLRPLTLVRAKPAVPVAGEPLVRRIIAWLAGQGVTEIVLNLHHLPETLAAVVGDGSDMGAHVRYSWEQPVVLGSAGGPRHALPIVGADTFFLVNGDTITDVDLDALAAAHASSGALATFALVPNQEPDRYGGLRLAGDGRVEGFVSRGARARGSYHFVGVQVVHADAFRGLTDGEPRNSVGDVYEALLGARPGSIRGHVYATAGFWDVGTPADYVATSRALLGDRPLEGAYGRRVRVDPSALVTRSILWDDVEVGPGCTVEDCVVTDGVHIPPNSSYRRAVLRRGEGAPLVDVLAQAHAANS